MKQGKSSTSSPPPPTEPLWHARPPLGASHTLWHALSQQPSWVGVTSVQLVSRWGSADRESHSYLLSDSLLRQTGSLFPRQQGVFPESEMIHVNFSRKGSQWEKRAGVGSHTQPSVGDRAPRNLGMPPSRVAQRAGAGWGGGEGGWVTSRGLRWLDKGKERKASKPQSGMTMRTKELRDTLSCRGGKLPKRIF